MTQKTKTEDERMRFFDRMNQLMKEKGKCWFGLEDAVGVYKRTVYRGVKTRSTLAAIAYYLEMRVEDMVNGTDAEDVWYN